MDQDQDPSVRLARVAEGINAVAARQEERTPLRDILFWTTLLMVTATLTIVAYTAWSNNTRDADRRMSACRSELASSVQVELATTVGGIAESATIRDNDVFNRELLAASAALDAAAKKYDEGARLSRTDPERFLEQCQGGD